MMSNSDPDRKRIKFRLLVLGTIATVISTGIGTASYLGIMPSSIVGWFNSTNDATEPQLYPVTGVELRETEYEKEIPAPNVREMDVKVDPNTVQIFTSGPFCVVGTCLDGNGDERRGSVIVLLPRDKPYHLYGLVPYFNSRHIFSGDPNRWLDQARPRVNWSFGPDGCGVHSCQTVYLLVVGGNGVIRNTPLSSPSDL